MCYKACNLWFEANFCSVCTGKICFQDELIKNNTWIAKQSQTMNWISINGFKKPTHMPIKNSSLEILGKKFIHIDDKNVKHIWIQYIIYLLIFILSLYLPISTFSWMSVNIVKSWYLPPKRLMRLILSFSLRSKDYQFRFWW